MTNRTHFRSIFAPTNGGRTGILEVTSPFAERVGLETPAVVPGINIVGGPPGPERNGGIWRGVKWWMFLYEQVPAFQCNILHPLEMDQVGPTWSGWREKPFTKWITDWQRQTDYPIPDNNRPENGYPFRAIMKWWEFWQLPPGQISKAPIAFSESAGHALSRESLRVKCEEESGLSVSQSSILSLQLEMGADVVMSLDYPLLGRLSAAALRANQAQSISNGLMLLELVAEKNSGVMPYIIVHGLDRKGMEAYIDEFMAGWRKLPKDARAVRFGVAVGSLTPIASQYHKLIDIMCGVRAGLRRAESELGWKPPVHVLGTSAQLMAVMVYLGADTLSTQSYTDMAQRRQYLSCDLHPVHVSQVSVADLIACGCPYCSELVHRNFWPEMQAVLMARGDEAKKGGLRRYYRQTPTGEAYTKSDLSALLAMHNWKQITRHIEQIRRAVQKDRLSEFIVARATKDPSASRLLKVVKRLADAEELAGESRSLRTALQESLAGDGQRFVLPEGYEPPEDKDVLVLIHRQADLDDVRRALLASPVVSRVHLVQVLAGYGVVPAELTTGGPSRVPSSPQHQTALQENLADYMGRFRRYYRHIFVLGEDEPLCQAVADSARRVETIKELLLELRQLPKRPDKVQLSLWDHL